MSRIIAVCIVGLMSVGSVSRADDASVSPEVSSIVSKALPAIRTGGAEWIADKDCLSCHRVSFQVWSLNRAAEAGFETDLDELRGWNQWATKWQNMVAPERRDDAKEEKTLGSESDTIAQLILGRQTSVDDAEHDWLPNYRTQLLKSQQKSGSWKPAGQLPFQKRPKRETEEVTTMWTLVGLKNSGVDAKELKPVATKAINWLGKSTKAKSTEWWATRLLLERAFGEKDKATELRTKLLSHQREDGGWGWLTTDDSDALGTGIALFALARDGLKSDEPIVRRATAFLAKTQQGDGSWEVRGTKKNSRDDVTDTASYWGTCWAVIGLLEFNHHSRSAASRSTSE